MKGHIFTLVLGFFACTGFAQSSVLRGEVFDEYGLLPGVEILISDVTTRISTDADGAFAVKLEPGDYELFFRFPQYNNEVRNVTILADDIRDMEVEMTLNSENAQTENTEISTGIQLENYRRAAGEWAVFFKTLILRMK